MKEKKKLKECVKPGDTVQYKFIKISIREKESSKLVCLEKSCFI